MPNRAVLIVEDDSSFRNALCETLESDEQPVIVTSSNSEALSILACQDIGLVVSDLEATSIDGHTLLSTIRQRHPSLPAIIMSASNSISDAVNAMRSGAADFLVKPFDPRDIQQVVGKYLKPLSAIQQPVAADPVTLRLLNIAERVAKTEATVTLSGDSGTGKEVFARYIHQQSPRCDMPFVAINCAAIPENMLEAVLFGYEKGAFTGASLAHAGKFEQADNGTLLLDEISEMEHGLQAKLLRVLQEREVERIGGRKTIPLNVRVLATTNRDLRQYVSDGFFREDLYYRLNVFPLRVPALSERPGDIVPLAEMALERYALTFNGAVEFTDCAREKLLSHNWQGNVRELENLIQRTLILLQGTRITAQDLAFEQGVGQAGAHSDDAHLQDGMKIHEEQLIADALHASNGKRAVAAKALGISPRTLRYKLARMRACGKAIPGETMDANLASTTPGSVL